MASSTEVVGDRVNGSWVIRSDTILMFCLAGVLMKTLWVEKAVVGLIASMNRRLIKSFEIIFVVVMDDEVG